MAPSHMFSYLRPGHAKRHPSASLTASSPEPVLSSSPLPVAQPSVEYLSSPRLPENNANAGYVSSSPVSPFPPQLPPIPRVASKLDKSGASSLLSPQHAAALAHNERGGKKVDTRERDDRAAKGRQEQQEWGSVRDQPRAQEKRPPMYEHRSSSSPAVGSSPSGFRAKGQSLAQVVEHATSPETHSQPPTHLAAFAMSPNYAANSKSQTSLMSGLGDKLSSTPKPSAPTAQPQNRKSRLNLRNPMSLLMRRRSGQTLDPLADESLVTQRSPSIVPPMPDNYDPSIRGRIVHDFSAPRPNRNFSYNNAYTDETRKVDASPPKMEREHTPVFREHFDDETSYEQNQKAIRAETLVNKDFLARNSYIAPPPPGRSPPLPPPMVKASSPPPIEKIPSPVPPPQPAYSPPPPPPQASVQEFSSSILSPVQEASSPTSPPIKESPRKRKSTKTPPPTRSRATSMTDPSFTPAGLPAHLTSRSSRFSFQIGGGESAAQEQILEERHKVKEAEKASKKEVRVSTQSMEDDYDEYGMDDDFDMDGGYEEDDIPMLGEEDEYGGLGHQTMSPGMAAFDFSSLSIQPHNPMSPVSMMGDAQTPRDINGNPIGFAMSEDMLQKLKFSATGHTANGDEASTGGLHGLGLMNMQQGHNVSQYTPTDTPDENTIAATKGLDLERDLGDELYFDDGLIDEQGEIDAVEFDESVFDDPEGPLFERRVKPPRPDELLPALASNPPDTLSSETGYEADDDTLSKHLEKSEPSLAHATSRAQQKPAPVFNNLDAYHGALADAAQRAEAQGRFARKASIDVGHVSSDADESSSISNSRPSLVPDDGRFSQETMAFPPDDDDFGMASGFVDDYDYSEYDSALEDDPMIAEANAEALANDWEGFYGQEFGFYAAAQGEAVNAYGGYFGSSALGRAASGRNALREPNLTPITERSEYSTRNSFISLNHFRDSAQLTSPGLAQLARISPYGWRDEEDMSLDSLMKLRKGAFGSTASLPGSSSNSPRNSSPMGMQYVPRTSSAAGHRMVEHNESSLESSESAGKPDNLDDDPEEDDDVLVDAINDLPSDYDEEDEDSDERPDSPTLTASDYHSLSSPTSHLSTAADIPPMPQMPLHAPPLVPNQHPLLSLSSVPPPTSPPPLTVHTSFNPSNYAHAQPPPPTTTISPSLSSPPIFPTATSTSTNSAAGPPRRQSLASPLSTSSPVTPGGGAGSGGWKAGHSRKGSAADSVAYVREDDGCGSERWVLERRRTAESGELELVGRMVVEGGRI